MKQTIPLLQLEHAINFWRSRFPSEPSSMKLCRQASSLANLYGYCIVESLSELPIEMFNEYQLECLAVLDSAEKPIEQLEAA